MLKRVTILTIFALVFILAACSSDNNSSNPSTTTLTGIWTLKSYEIKNMGLGAGKVPVTNDLKLTLNTDNTYNGYMVTAIGSTETSSGTYTVSGNTLTTTSTSQKITNYTFTLSGNNLTISQTTKLGGFDISVDNYFTK